MGKFYIFSVCIGSLLVLVVLFELVLKIVVGFVGYECELNFVFDVIQEFCFEFECCCVIVGYIWEFVLFEWVCLVVVNLDDLVCICVVYERLVGFFGEQVLGVCIGLFVLFGLLFDIDGSDQCDNWWVVIFVLVVYLFGKNFVVLIFEVVYWLKVCLVILILYGCIDLIQYFVVLVVLVVWVGELIVDVIGFYKELVDVCQGSGFFFVDLVVDCVGMVFGELLIGQFDRFDLLLKIFFIDIDFFFLLVGLFELINVCDFC